MSGLNRVEEREETPLSDQASEQKEQESSEEVEQAQVGLPGLRRTFVEQAEEEEDEIAEEGPIGGNVEAIANELEQEQLLETNQSFEEKE